LDRLFSRLGDIVLALLARSSPGRGRSAGSDPFLREAEEELEGYLRGRNPRPSRREQSGPPPPAARPPAHLLRDYANLEVDPGASFEEVRRAHRRLIRRYHPDRFGADPEKQRLATEISQRLNDSLRRIRDFRSTSD
jgi:DnaJ-domain-containing protein 1